MPERLPTLHDAMVAVLGDHDDRWMAREEIASEIARRGLWVRPSDGAAPQANQIRLRARKYPDLFELSADGSSVRLSGDGPPPPAPSTPSRRPPARSKPARPDPAGVWALTENDVVEACRARLEGAGYEILASATTMQRGPDLIARSADRETEIRVEAKGATSSKEHTNRFGRPFTGGQVLQHVSRAFYTAAASLPLDRRPSVRSAMAFPDTPLHRARVDALRHAIDRLDIGVFWISPESGAQLEAEWSL